MDNVTKLLWHNHIAKFETDISKLDPKWAGYCSKVCHVMTSDFQMRLCADLQKN